MASRSENTEQKSFLTGGFAAEPEIGVIFRDEVRSITSGILANRIAGVRAIRLVPGKDQAIRVIRIVIRRNVDDVLASSEGIAQVRQMELARRRKRDGSSRL
jgi:hypothetical protein